MYPVYRSLNNEELLHDTYNNYRQAMREAIYLVRTGLSKKATVQTATDIKTVVLGKNKTIFISGRPLTN